MSFFANLHIAFRTAALMRSQWWPHRRIAEYQQAHLRDILWHATSRIPHYRDLKGGEEMPAMDWLQRFPILTKAELQSSADQLHDKQYAIEHLKSSRTSGSTGEPTTTYFDDNTWMTCKYALKARRVLNAVNPLMQRLLVISERDDNATKTFNSVSGRGLLFSSLNLFVEDRIEENVKALTAFRPTILQTYPSYLEHLAEKLSQTENPPRIPLLFTSSELLTDQSRERLESTFSGKVIDIYGSTEFKEIAVQCKYGRYHINFESVFVEEVPDPVAETPHLLITTMLNKAMPLIRYDIGDHGDVDHGDCACRRHGPYISNLYGRKSELLCFPDGTAVTSYVLTTAIGKYEEIRNYTIVHRQPDEVALKLYTKPPMSEERVQQLLARLASLLPDGTKLTIEALKDRLPDGKRVAVRREFDPD